MNSPLTTHPIVELLYPHILQVLISLIPQILFPHILNPQTHQQAPLSYRRCAALVDAYLSTHIVLHIKPEDGDGLIFFNGKSLVF